MIAVGLGDIRIFFIEAFTIKHCLFFFELILFTQFIVHFTQEKTFCHFFYQIHFLNSTIYPLLYRIRYSIVSFL